MGLSVLFCIISPSLWMFLLCLLLRKCKIHSWVASREESYKKWWNSYRAENMKLFSRTGDILIQFSRDHLKLFAAIFSLKFPVGCGFKSLGQSREYITSPPWLQWTLFNNVVHSCKAPFGQHKAPHTWRALAFNLGCTLYPPGSQRIPSWILILLGGRGNLVFRAFKCSSI